jgi:hypothetical protein
LAYVAHRSGASIATADELIVCKRSERRYDFIDDHEREIDAERCRKKIFKFAVEFASAFVFSFMFALLCRAASASPSRNQVDFRRVLSNA